MKVRLSSIGRSTTRERWKGPPSVVRVVVVHDLLGFNPAFKPRFVRRYADGTAFVFGAEVDDSANFGEEGVGIGGVLDDGGARRAVGNGC